MSTKGGGIFVILQGRGNYRGVVNSCLENGKERGVSLDLRRVH